MENRSFYNEILTEHNIHPEFKHDIPDADIELAGVNPSCGDNIVLKLKKLDEELPTPAYANPGDAGLDLYAAQDVVLDPGERALIPTGIAIAIPEGFAGFVQPRSGLAAKQGFSIVNTPD